MSPFEHTARTATTDDIYDQCERIGIPRTALLATDVDLRRFHFGAFRGWCSLRWTMPGEAVFGGGEP